MCDLSQPELLFLPELPWQLDIVACFSECRAAKIDINLFKMRLLKILLFIYLIQRIVVKNNALLTIKTLIVNIDQ